MKLIVFTDGHYFGLEFDNINFNEIAIMWISVHFPAYERHVDRLFKNVIFL